MPLVPKAIVKLVAMRYVAGEDLESALATVADLNTGGCLATMDILGEHALSGEAADQTVGEYLEVLEKIRSGDLNSNISVKLTHLGILLDYDGAVRRLGTLVDALEPNDNFLRIDMEDSSLTESTINLFREIRGKTPRVGTVLQSYLRRTESDARALGALGANIRLCKGIYREPEEIAFQDPDEIRESYIRSARALFESPDSFVGFATHDRALVKSVLELVQELKIPTDRFEFQALLGVPVEDLFKELIEQGYSVRWYVPFGVDWYAYSTRRLKENPKMATYIVRQMFSPRRKRPSPS